MKKDLHRAILFVHTQKKGYRKNLTEEFDESVVNELANLGYIIQGSTLDDNDPNQENFVRTWKETDKSIRYVNSNVKKVPTKEKVAFGRFLYNIGVR